MKTSFWDAYGAAVTELRSGCAVTMSEICDQLERMKDELEAIATRLVERGTIDKLDA